MKKSEQGIFRFSSLGIARSFVAHCIKTMFILLGDDGRYWVTSPARAITLLRAGYELAE